MDALPAGGQISEEYLQLLSIGGGHPDPGELPKDDDFQYEILPDDDEDEDFDEEAPDEDDADPDEADEDDGE